MHDNPHIPREPHGQAEPGRRDFLQWMAAAGGMGLLGLSGPAQAQPSPRERFVFARLKYAGGDWDTDMLRVGLGGGAEINLLERLGRNTNVMPRVEEFVLRANDENLGQYPFLYATGHQRIQFLDDEVDNLRHALRNGSLLFAEDCAGDGIFARDFKQELRVILPEHKLIRIPMDHPLYRYPYEIREILGGDKKVFDYMEGVEIDGRLAVIYTDNDLGCAWEGHPCSPGGEKQRDHAFQLGMNIACYAMGAV